ncbi:hypothetical protein GCM10022223_68120 [Kineosporia mesophila]|uniref:Uncharacterized protein n=1 Tax=Kineosporia mesophila TaxID=566012 RepID=A0ABP7ATR0_9ACTN
MIRPLTPAGIPAGQAVATAHGWPPRPGRAGHRGCAADSVFLHAPAAGRPIHENLDFRCVDELVTHAGPWPPAGLRTTVRVTSRDEVVTALDAEAVGYSRRALRRRPPAFAEQIRVAHDDAGRPSATPPRGAPPSGRRSAPWWHRTVPSPGPW